MVTKARRFAIMYVMLPIFKKQGAAKPNRGRHNNYSVLGLKQLLKTFRRPYNIQQLESDGLQNYL